MDLVWMQEGSCRDQPPATFFPSDGVGIGRPPHLPGVPRAQAVSRYALNNDIDHGVWVAPRSANDDASCADAAAPDSPAVPDPSAPK